MSIVLVHPTLGAKVANGEGEIREDMKRGWVKYEPPVVKPALFPQVKKDEPKSDK